MADSTRLERASATRRFVSILALAGLAAALCFYRLGHNGVHELDEAWQAQAALEMYHNGHWWRPTAFGGPFFSKPAFPVWLTVTAYHLFGISDFATRFWAASFAVGTVLATYLLGEAIAGIAVGTLAGFVLATTYPFIYTHCARTGEFDSLMVLSFVAATILFARAARTKRGWSWCAAAAAMASHAKNFAGVVPAVVFVLSIWLVPSERRPTARQALQCMLLFAVLNLIWLLPMVLLHGNRFWVQFVGTEVLHRPFKAGSHSVQSAAALYFLSLFAGFWPWAILGIGGLVEDARKAASQRDVGSILVLSWIGVLSLVLCFGLRRANQWYLIPLFPFLAISAGRLLVGGDERPAWAEMWRVATAAVALAVAVVWQLRPLTYPFALWSISRPQLEAAAAGRVASLLVGLAVVGLGGWWFRQGPGKRGEGRDSSSTPARHLRHSAGIGVVAVLGLTALINVARPLAAADYTNAYVRAREVLKNAQGDRHGTLIVNTPEPRFDRITRYYFANIDRMDASFVRQGPRAALAKARQLRAPVWCVLTARRGRLPQLGNPSEHVLFKGDEPLPGGGTRFELAVVEIDGSAVGGAEGREP